MGHKFIKMKDRLIDFDVMPLTDVIPEIMQLKECTNCEA